MKYKKLLFIAASCLMTTSTFATVVERCPSVASMVSAGLDQVVIKKDQEQNDFWVGIQTSKYNTKHEWRLYVAGFDDDTTTDANAKQQALSAMPSLVKYYGPINTDEQYYVCYYSDPNNKYLAAFLITPPKDILDIRFRR